MKVATCTDLGRLQPSAALVKASLISSAMLHCDLWPYEELKPLGLVFRPLGPHAPSLGLALEGRVQLLEDGSFDHAVPRMHLDEFNPAPARKMFDRLKSFSRPTLSIVARCTGYNTFILSVMPFSLSYFGLTSKDLNWLRQTASKYILKRKWIEAEILPYILRYVGITTLLDPALSAAVAALGLYLREGNPLEDLHQLGNDGRCSNGRQRAVVSRFNKYVAPIRAL